MNKRLLLDENSTHVPFARFKRVVALLLVGALMATSVTAVGEIEEDEPVGPRDFRQVLRESSSVSSAGIMSGIARGDLYQHYYAQHSSAPRPSTQIRIPMGRQDLVTRPDTELNVLPQFKVGSYEGRDNLLFWGNDLGEFDFTFNVQTTGLYHLQFDYRVMEPGYTHSMFSGESGWDNSKIIGMNNAIELGVMINGEYPFAAARNLSLEKFWMNEGATARGRRNQSFMTDNRGHEMLPRQVAYYDWISRAVIDNEGLFNEPLFFYLESGENTITLTGIKVDGVAFESMTFLNFTAPAPYVRPDNAAINGTPKMHFESNDLGTYTILLEGEHPLYRNSTELGATYDATTEGLSPYDPVKMRHNIVGGNDSWQRPGQALTWEFEIRDAGYYRFSAKVRQNSLRGFSANRRVLTSSLVNGVWTQPTVPVAEFESVTFPYSFSWYSQNFTTDNRDPNAEDVFLYFEPGFHRVTMETVPGDIGESLMRLHDEITLLNYYYRSILMITGPDPDDYTPYNVHNQIPELIPEFTRIAQALRDEKEHIERLSRSGSEAAMLETMAIILERCIANPNRIPQRLISLRDNISALSAWVRQAGRQPLQLDFVEVTTAHESPARATSGFFGQLMFLWRGFIGSFTEDFTRLGDGGEGKDINVWVGLGRDQALTLKHLVDGEFNADNSHDVWISINLVQGGILEASLAGKGPDVGLFIGGDFPIQLAARGLLTNLRQFGDYQNIVDARFAPDFPTIFTYLDGVYALPISQVFPMMFYRTDILEDLGIEPPRDWEEVEEAIRVLQRSFLGVGLFPPTMPPPPGMVITTFEAGDTFAILHSQTGQGFYRRNDDNLYFETTFNTPQSIEAFNTWTRFYTVHGFDQTYDALSRFRVGTYPIVIQGYPFYNLLNGAAPEIRGQWNFRHVPGSWRTLLPGESSNSTRFIDSRINSSTGAEEFLDISATSGGSGGIIFNHLSNDEQQGAWEFLKWLTSDDIQTRFGQNMEAMLGPLGRYDTANVNAMRNLAWSELELARLETQRDALNEIPMIPANYSVIRHIKNAFRAVVNENHFPRFALESYNRDINAEIERKNAELARNQRRNRD
jgi:ABC-type glycerol-3-phosphate transport system substrate-binding protein